MKAALSNPSVLALPNNSDPFILDVDATQVAVGTEFTHVQDGEERVIAFSSFSRAEELLHYPLRATCHRKIYKTI